MVYKLKLSDTRMIHPVIHVSQLRKALLPSVNAQPDLPELTEEDQIPVQVLRSRLSSKGAATTTQVMVQWLRSSPSPATWEDYNELGQHFPRALAWGQASSQWGRISRHLLPGGLASPAILFGMSWVISAIRFDRSKLPDPGRATQIKRCSMIQCP